MNSLNFNFPICKMARVELLNSKVILKDVSQTATVFFSFLFQIIQKSPQKVLWIHLILVNSVCPTLQTQPEGLLNCFSLLQSKLKSAWFPVAHWPHHLFIGISEGQLLPRTVPVPGFINEQQQQTVGQIDIPIIGYVRKC